MRAFSVKYEEGIDNTEIKFSKEFEDAHYIMKLDILQDAIYDLENIYNKILKEKKDIYLATGRKLMREKNESS
jgi:hypothetical protein